MYKYLGIGLLGLFVIMVMPTGNDVTDSATLFYGGATIIANDADGKEFFKQTVHNQITNEGESLLIQMVFNEAGEWEPGNVSQFGSICITDAVDGTPEDETAADFEVGNTLTDKAGGHCRTDGAVDNSTVGLAVIESGVFTASGKAGANIAVGEIIDGIAICQADAGGAGTNSTSCITAPGDTTGRALAILETSDVTLGESETASITYTFDISSANT